MKDARKRRLQPTGVRHTVRILLLIAAAVAVEPWGHSVAFAQVAEPTVLITGSNKGIGFFFVQGYAERGWKVIATCRNPAGADQLKEYAAKHSNIVIEELDVTDFDEIESLAEKYRDTPIDVLLNNAGINPYRAGPMSRFGDMDYDRFEEILKVNVIGPLFVSETFLDHVAASEQKKIIVMTSTGGSITNAHIMAKQIGVPDYRASKAAVNMIMRLLAVDIAERDVIVGIIGPGSVDTRGVLKADPATLPPGTRKRIASGKEMLLDPNETIGSMITLIDGLTLEDSGVFYNWEGEVLPW